MSDVETIEIKKRGRPKKEKTFAEQEGLPSNVQAKTLAKESKNLVKEKQKFQVVFYTVIQDKVMRCVVKPNGLYQTYVGRKSRMGKDLPDMITKWKRDGQWLEAHEVEVCSANIRKTLEKQYQEFLATK